MIYLIGFDFIFFDFKCKLNEINKKKNLFLRKKKNINEFVFYFDVVFSDFLL